MRSLTQPESHTTRNVLLILAGLAGLAFIIGWIIRPNS